MIVDPEFQALCRKLKPEEYSQLRENIVRDGCRDSLVLWQEEDILLDGHNRYDICEEHKVPYHVKSIQLPGRDAAKLWIIRNQFGRRNLTAYQRAVLALAMEPLLAETARERQREGGQTKLPQNSGEAKRNRETDRQLADEAGLSHDTIAKAKYLHRQADDVTQQRLIDGETTINAEYTKLRHAEKEQQREARRAENAQRISSTTSLDDLPAAGARFATIVLDPPWDWGDEGDCDQLGRARPTYGTMPLEKLLELPVDKLADEDCHLYLWITNRSLPKGFSLLERWGFRYVTALTWCKPSFGLGNYFRGSTEHVLFGVRGSQPLKRKDIGTWFAAPRGPLGHSSKPVEFYDLVESCSPGPYLEMFARGNRNGWVSWGADTNGN